MDEIEGPTPPTTSVWQPGAHIPPPTWLERLIDVVRGPVGPYVTAVVFALVALPVVLLDVEVYAKQFTTYQDVRLPPTDPSVLTASLLAVLLAGVVGSIVGVPFARRRAGIGWGATLVTAWLTGIVALPVGPTIAGLPYATARVCFDGCRAGLVAPGVGIPDPPVGVLLSPIFAPWTLAALAVGAGLWAWLVNQAAHPAPVAPP